MSSLFLKPGGQPRVRVLDPQCAQDGASRQRPSVGKLCSLCKAADKTITPRVKNQ